MRPRPLLLTCLALCACAVSTRHLTLHYPPLEATSVEPRAPHARHVRVGPIHDDRPFPRVAITRTPLGEVAQLYESREPLDSWVLRGLVHEFARAGYTLDVAPGTVDEGVAPGAALLGDPLDAGMLDEEALQLEVRVSEALASTRGGHAAHLALYAWFRSNHGRVLAQPVIEEDVVLAPHSSGAAEALALALRRAALRLIAIADGLGECEE